MLAVTAACGDAATTVPTAISETVSAPIVTPISGSIETPGAGPAVQGLIVRVDELEFPVEVAVSPEERIKGLSGRASLDAGTGMLFVFEKADRLRFWMREMEFPLDMVWISAGCRVVDISDNVPQPEPDTSLADLPRYSPEAVAKYVLEINAGESAELGLGVGDRVEFLGELAGRYDC